jgi:hypothetical protein
MLLHRRALRIEGYRMREQIALFWIKNSLTISRIKQHWESSNEEYHVNREVTL